MKATKSRTIIGKLCCVGALGFILCIVILLYVGKVAANLVADVRMNEVAGYTEYVTIIETFCTTDRYGNPKYHIMWEGNNYTDIMDVCSGCYMKYRDAAEMPIKVTKLESKYRRGYNFCLHNHYNYERTDK